MILCIVEWNEALSAALTNYTDGEYEVMDF